ncbi:hypothetical protein BST61_g2902 [Cercospora zeina]
MPVWHMFRLHSNIFAADGPFFVSTYSSLLIIQVSTSTAPTPASSLTLTQADILTSTKVRLQFHRDHGQAASSSEQSGHYGQSASNSTLITRADADQGEVWFPFDNQALTWSDAYIHRLRATEEQKRRLRRAKWGLQVLQKMSAPVSDPPTAYLPAAPGVNGPTSNRLLKTYGWRGTGDPMGEELERQGLNPAFLGLGISTGGGDWFENVVKHSEEMIEKSSGKTYPPTGGEYASLFNFKDGVIVSLIAFSPDVTARKPEYRVPADVVTRLKTFSDVVYLNYHACMSSIGLDPNAAPKIQHVFLHNPVNANTLNVLQSVTGKQNANEVGKWPGMSIGTCTPQGFNLLSAPEVYDVALLLIQHKQGGPRMIDRLNIFDCDEGSSSGIWCVYMHVADHT